MLPFEHPRLSKLLQQFKPEKLLVYLLSSHCCIARTGGALRSPLCIQSLPIIGVDDTVHDIPEDKELPPIEVPGSRGKGLGDSSWKYEDFEFDWLALIKDGLDFVIMTSHLTLNWNQLFERTLL